MTEQQLFDKIKTQLKTFPRERKGRDENDSVMDDCGGNVDDAYSMGFNDGESYFAEYIKGFLLDLIDEYNKSSKKKEISQYDLDRAERDAEGRNPAYF